MLQIKFKKKDFLLKENIYNSFAKFIATALYSIKINEINISSYNLELYFNIIFYY